MEQDTLNANALKLVSI